MFTKGEVVFANAMFGANQLMVIKNPEYSFGGYNLVYVPCFAILVVLDAEEYLHKKNDIHLLKCFYN